MFCLVFCSLCLLALGPGLAQDAPSQTYATRFEAAWRLVDERYWDLEQTGVDWTAQRAAYEPRALAAPDDAAFYAVLVEMYDELGDDHSVFVPPSRVAEIRAQYGDLPCLGVFSWALEPQTLGVVRFELLPGSVGLVILPDLASANVAAQLREAVTTLERAGATAFVLDMRGNPGGRLVEMMQAAGVFTSGFLWRTLTSWTLPLPYPAIGTPATSLPLVILIDERVNSAAEGLAGALQQQGRATVVGRPSAGNVEAVLPFCLRDGSQAWIATGVLAPIGAATWEGRGVVPDLESEPEAALGAALEFLRALAEDAGD